MEDFEVDELIELIPITSSKFDPTIFSNTFQERGIIKRSINLGNEIRLYTDILRREIESDLLPQRTGEGNIKLLKMYILNESNLQPILKDKFYQKILPFKDKILEYFNKEWLLQDPPTIIKKSQINKFSKKLTKKYIFDQVIIVLNKWFDLRGIFDMNVRYIFNGKLAITDTAPRDMIYDHFRSLLKQC